MRITEWLRTAERQLSQSQIPTARLDSLVLAEDITKKERGWLLAHPEYELTTAQSNKLKNLLRRRQDHEPLAYIRGKTEFYGREFVITPAVLEPRPESETMIDLLKQLPLFNVPRRKEVETKQSEVLSMKYDSENSQLKKEGLHADSPLRIADVGAGSGALGITAALELPKTQVELLELDPAALEVAKSNVDLFTLTISVIKSNLLADTTNAYDILLCNLPYVPDTHTISPAALREPTLAIFGGPDGLNIYRDLFAQIKMVVKSPLYILTEALPPQHTALQVIAENSGYKLQITDDFIQVFQRLV